MANKSIKLNEKTFKKVNTIKELDEWIQILKKSNIDLNTPILMQSDEEGNAVNKVLCLCLYDDGLTFVPWEG